MSWKAPHVIRYELPYQPILERESNSLVISGMAWPGYVSYILAHGQSRFRTVVIMVLSRATRNMLTKDEISKRMTFGAGCSCKVSSTRVLGSDLTAPSWTS